MNRRLSSEWSRCQGQKGMTITCCPGSSKSFWWPFIQDKTDWTVICTKSWSWHPHQPAPVVKKTRLQSMFCKDAHFTKLMGGSEKFWFYWKTKKMSSRGPGVTQALVGSRGKTLGRGPMGLSPPSSHSFLHLFFFSSASISQALIVSLSWTEPGIAHGKKRENF